MPLDAPARIAELEATLVAKNACIAELEHQVGELRDLVAELHERLGQNSSNSHKPPSSDPPGGPRGCKGKGQGQNKPKRKRGGQRGHKGHHRALIPPSEVTQVVDCYPPQCESCWKSLPPQCPSGKRA